MNMNVDNNDPATATMARSKFATVMTRNTRKIPVILAYAFLEWVLIILLLTNSCFAYLIRKFSAYFGLKPPCPWCSRVDHLLEPVKSADPFRALVCETHGSEISKLTYCSNHQKLAESETMCEECFSSQPKNSPKTCRCSCCEKTVSEITHNPYFPYKGSLDKQEIEEEKDEIRECKAKDGDNNHSGSECEHQVLSDDGSFYLREAAEDEESNEDEETGNGNVKEEGVFDDGEVPEGNEDGTNIRRIEQNEVAITELENHAGGKHSKQTERSTIEEETFLADRVDHLLLLSEPIKALVDEPLSGYLVCQTESCDQNYASFTIQRLICDLEAERKSRNDLYAELEAERSAAAIAANQTMAMITRLQEEKAMMQMEARQYQRMMEEQAEYDQEELQFMSELMMKTEIEKQELKKEIEKQKLEKLDDKAMMMIIDNDSNDSSSDVLSIDLNRQYGKGEDDKKDIVSLLDISNEWGAIGDSLKELEEERLSIIQQLKDLEEKLDQPSGELLCSQEVNLVMSDSRPKTMASAAQKLLNFVESGDDETKEDETNGSEIEVVENNETKVKRVAIKKEMDHVYGRLQALEADSEFLRHCIGSVNKGNVGVNLLQEILQHLHELRAGDICM